MTYAAPEHSAAKKIHREKKEHIEQRKLDNHQKPKMEKLHVPAAKMQAK